MKFHLFLITENRRTDQTTLFVHSYDWLVHVYTCSVVFGGYIIWSIFSVALFCHSFLFTDRVTSAEGAPEHLRFNSQFESGNLRKAIQVNAHTKTPGGQKTTTKNWQIILSSLPDNINIQNKNIHDNLIYNLSKLY